MRRLGFQILGYAVWSGGRWYLRRRYGDAPRKLALAGLVALALAALLLGGRRAARDSA
jgi:hypothetical protein